MKKINETISDVINLKEDTSHSDLNIHIVKGDITTFVGDAVVNAANKYLAPGGGVCGSIFNKAGYRELQNECIKIGGCEVGNAIITNGYKLKANYIIHAVGPNYLYD